MIAIISNKNDAHADFLQKEICSRRFEVIRINTEDLLATPLTIDYTHGVESVPFVFGDLYSKLRFVTAFWYRRPLSVPASISDDAAQKFFEAETRAVLAGLWYLFDSAYWISFPDIMNRAANKLLQLSAARRLNFNVPKTIITTDPGEVAKFHAKCGGEIIAKAVHQSWFEKMERSQLFEHIQ
ncbi:MAG: hypothetical protein IPG22_07340 [Acidobacteria bacterium]|nr:hypothetical protein [Acidobacteriota bacterium]